MKKEATATPVRSFSIKPTAADVILAALLVLISLSVFLIMRFNRDEGALVTVSINSEPVATYSLILDGEYPILDGELTLTVKDGEAFVSHSSCSDKSCVRSGRISHSGESIVCLPNRVSITVVAEESDVDITLK
ncbi:MAG: NusG domain II-containing protein [Clostridia bacterium]|nr:NusG domain II-containing protein [Clostridia bacterium]